MLAGERDQQAPALQVGAVEHDRRQDLAGDRRLGYLDVPAPRRRCTKRASRPPEAALGRRGSATTRRNGRAGHAG
ncbi:hypothetical protein JOE56_001986 [Brevibacterium paucivorans]|uniref:Uncharacterized protein n=1 Tax=Brevibacterium paucivorans TaxID=170994 RepID=A0ABS2SLZ7_9MICO|nr:hypothetical protein [Brevibacterium paucivorans]